MTWTDPRTYTVGELIDAATLNTYVRDNLNESEAAKVTAAGDLVYASGVEALSRLAIGSAGRWLRVSGGVPVWDTTAPSSALLARTVYDPGSVATYTTSSATMADVDATNLSIAFTSPASGNIVVILAAFADKPTGGIGAWGLRESSSLVSGSEAKVLGVTGAFLGNQRCIYRNAFTGLSGSKTWKWAYARETSGSWSIYAGGDPGPAIMEVWALP
jgi:hypothetical protein